MHHTLGGNIDVVNWAKEPLFELSRDQLISLNGALIYARQIASDACDVLARYRHYETVLSFDAQMAKECSDPTIAVESLEKYFGFTLPPNVPISSAQALKLTVIREKFDLIKKGLDGPFEVVVGHIFDADDLHEGVCKSLRKFFHGNVKGAAKDLKGIVVKTRGWVDPNPVSQRRIHLNVSMWNHYKFTPSQIARVIVHEASHKWAGTKDNHDMQDQSRGSGYKSASELKFNAQQTVASEKFVDLTNNADSFAWGGRLIWKRTRKIAKGS